MSPFCRTTSDLAGREHIPEGRGGAVDQAPVSRHGQSPAPHHVDQRYHHYPPQLGPLPHPQGRTQDQRGRNRRRGRLRVPGDQRIRQRQFEVQPYSDR